MDYISFADMGRTVVSKLYKIPQDIDLIVGIPRSGLLAGNIIALSLNLPIIDIDGFIYNRRLRHGFTRKTKTYISLPHEAKHILIVDDTIDTGKTMDRVKMRLKNSLINQQISFCSVYAEQKSIKKIDIFLEKLSSPSIFEWNIMNNKFLEDSCIDIDGVLCKDPLKNENDDNHAYLNFLKTVQPLSLPSLKVGYLVTNRLEKYREQTENWLHEHNIRYKKLHMLNLPDAATRKELNSYGSFKANVYKSYPDSLLFIESNKNQAIEITKLSGKPVLCFSNRKLYIKELVRKLQIEKTICEPKIISQGRRIAKKIWRLTNKIDLNQEVSKKDKIRQTALKQELPYEKELLHQD